MAGHRRRVRHFAERLGLKGQHQPIRRLPLSLSLLRRLPPPLCSSVLKPRFHLGVGHLQGFSERRPLGRRQILLFVKTFLQFGDLQPGEARPRLLSLRWRPVLIRMPDPPWKRSGYCQPVLEVRVSLERMRGQVGQQAGPVKAGRRRLLLAVLKGL